MKVLVIEDEQKISSYLGTGLHQEGYVVDAVALGLDGLSLFGQNEYDMVLLDLMLPDMSGYEVLRRIKERAGSPPVIILSAKGSVDDRVMGLRLGADDYMTKPVSFVELCGRIRAIMRRRHTDEKGYAQQQTINLGRLMFDRVRRQIASDSGTADLTARETLLLDFLIQNRACLVNKRLIFEHVWNYEANPQTNVVDVLICRLREKLGSVLGRDVIRTVRGLGYVFDVGRADAGPGAGVEKGSGARGR